RPCRGSCGSTPSFSCLPAWRCTSRCVQCAKAGLTWRALHSLQRGLPACFFSPASSPPGGSFGGRLFSRHQSRQRLLLSHDRHTRPEHIEQTCRPCARVRPGIHRRTDRRAPAPRRRTVRHLLALSAPRLAGRLRSSRRLGRRSCRALPATADVKEVIMAETTLNGFGAKAARESGLRGVAADWASEQRAFKCASSGKAMMWIFLLSCTFIFACFLLAYMTVRMSTVEPWPNTSEVFALHIGETNFPLLLIAIMTFVLISS